MESPSVYIVTHREPQLPDELAAALRADPRAFERFHQLPASHQREYVTWVREGRRDETRERRAAQAVMRLLQMRAESADSP